MKLLALDPSSTRTGYAVGTGPARDDLIDAGLLTPDRAGDAVERIRSMRADLLDLLNEHQPDAVIIEVPGPHTHRRIGHHAAGLPIYGMAVGVILDVCWSYQAKASHRLVRVDTVEPNDWTRGSRKAHRMRCMAADYPGYDARKDPGGDTADALALMQWWFRQQLVKER